MTKPLWLMDVDGVLNITSLLSEKGRRRLGPVQDDGTHHVVGCDVPVHTGQFHHYAIHWRADLPKMVAAIMSEFELVWATTWEDEANDFWLPKMGLNEPLPVIAMPTYRFLHSTCWKTPGVVEWLESTHNLSRPGVWADDEVSRHDRFHIGGLNPLRIDDWTGLTPAYIDKARRLSGLEEA